MTRERALLALRLLAGGVFVVFGLGKFVNHSSELASFSAYGLPAPGVFVIVIGVIELIGGVLLIAGLLVLPAALVLAGDMIGAIIVSGVVRGRNRQLDARPGRAHRHVGVALDGIRRAPLSGPADRRTLSTRRVAELLR